MTRILLPVSILKWLSMRLSQRYLDSNSIQLKRKFIASLIACISIFFLILYIESTSTFLDSVTEKFQHIHSDFVINLNKHQPFGGNENGEISILAVDDATYVGWEQPYITPRIKLREMIEFASRHKAAVIVVDFDLSRSEAWGGLTEGDKALMEYLVQIDRAKPGSVPAVILLRDVGRKDASKQIYDSFLMKSPALSDNRGNVFWGTATFPVDSDGLVRSFNWFESINNQRFASAPLLASFIYHQQKHSSNEAIARSHQWLMSIGDTKKISSSGNSLLSEISGRASNDFSNTSGFDNSIIMLHDNAAENIRVNGFGEVSSPKIERRIRPDFYRNNIVFIGAMHHRTMDHHETPIGDRYGVEMLAQTTAMIQHYGALQALNGAWLWSYNIILILAMTLIMLLPGMVPIIIATAIVGMLIYLPASILLYEQGFTLDAAPPLLLIQLAEPIIPFILCLLFNAHYIIENREHIFSRVVEKVSREWKQPGVDNV